VLSASELCSTALGHFFLTRLCSPLNVSASKRQANYYRADSEPPFRRLIVPPSGLNELSFGCAAALCGVTGLTREDT
jgi:hypothetical protein